MREIKFAGYHPKQGYCTPEEMCELNLTISPYGGVLYDNFAVELNWTLLQYTGLKDKNGSEIYEGHILETPYDYPGSDYYENDPGESGKYRGRVHYTPSKGFIQRGVIKLYDGDIIEWKKIKHTIEIRQHATKIIGHIYQNPELLENIK